MSLLMTALQRAEKSRIETGNRRSEELSLEALDVSEFATQPERVAYDPAQAATLLTAGERQSAVIDFARDHSFGLILTVLLLAGVMWGMYVGLQIKSPSLFVPKPTEPLAASPAPAEPPPPSAGHNEIVPATLISQAPMRVEAAAPAFVAEALPQERAEVVAPPPSQHAEVLAEEASAEPVEPVKPAPRAERARKVQGRPAPAAPADASEDQEIKVSRAVEWSLQQSPLARAYEAFNSNDYAAAKALYQEAQRADPKNPDSLLGLAAIATLEGNASEASRLYFKALELDPKNPTAQAGIISLSGRTDPANSEARLKSLIAKEPSAHLYSVLAGLHAEQAQWSQAQAAYFQAHHLAPQNADYAFNLAVSLEHLNQPRAALTYYRKALELGSERANFSPEAVQARIATLQSRTN
jgi:tetratricopeptide (TPR) repeat protein